MHDLYQSRENIQNLVHTPLTLPNDSSIGKQVKSKISGQSRSLILPEEHLLVPFLTHICLCFESCSCCCTSMTSPFQVFLVSSKLQWRNSQTYQSIRTSCYNSTSHGPIPAIIASCQKHQCS